MIKLGAAVTFALAATLAQAEARVPLSQDRQLEDGLTLVAIGHELTEACPEISPRYFKSLNFALGLQSRAKKLGYSDAEIEAYLDSAPDKARVEARARAYLEARGADFSQPATLCRVARAEIAQGTSVGGFLKVN